MLWAVFNQILETSCSYGHVCGSVPPLSLYTPVTKWWCADGLLPFTILNSFIDWCVWKVQQQQRLPCGIIEPQKSEEHNVIAWQTSLHLKPPLFFCFSISLWIFPTALRTRSSRMGSSFPISEFPISLDENQHRDIVWAIWWRSKSAHQPYQKRKMAAILTLTSNCSVRLRVNRTHLKCNKMWVVSIESLPLLSFWCFILSPPSGLVIKVSAELFHPTGEKLYRKSPSGSTPQTLR